MSDSESPPGNGKPLDGGGSGEGPKQVSIYAAVSILSCDRRAAIMTKTKRKKAALDGNRETAKEEKTLAAASPQHDSEAVNRAAALLGKLEQSEPQLFDSWQLSKNPTDASVWLECVHQLRQVARDLKYSDARIKQREEGAK